MTDLNDSIESAAAKPANTTIDGTTVNERPLVDLIAADQHVTGREALKKPRLGLITRKIRRGSALGE